VDVTTITHVLKMINVLLQDSVLVPPRIAQVLLLNVTSLFVQEVLVFLFSNKFLVLTVILVLLIHVIQEQNSVNLLLPTAPIPDLANEHIAVLLLVNVRK